MSEIRTRIDRLSPERRKLLEKMISQRSPEPEPSPQEVPAPPHSLSPTAGKEDTKTACRRMYDEINRQLDVGMFGEFSFFLNYGYVPDLSPQFAAVAVPEHYLNRNSVRLVLELIGDCPVDGRRVLDVGCGRGGIPHVLMQFFRPASVVGLDLSSAAIAFCRRVHDDPRMRFEVGDSENLPFVAESFDIVANLESSSCYPDVLAFYREVHRVLAPGGHFLYSDCLPANRFQDATVYLEEMGLRVERDRDITSNVLLSCDEIARQRVQAYGGASPELETFLGTPGSPYYEDMRTGRWTYRILQLAKQKA
ncbi:MAG TPA: methyltransferase domain-containing protein [Candidatus Tectomicrobia bacterium]|nr:methyltransferase domain-containing protein [Candidatus Tectomicrobia bacterium]